MNRDRTQTRDLLTQSPKHRASQFVRQRRLNEIDPVHPVLRLQQAAGNRFVQSRLAPERAAAHHTAENSRINGMLGEIPPLPTLFIPFLPATAASASIPLRDTVNGPSSASNGFLRSLLPLPESFLPASPTTPETEAGEEPAEPEVEAEAIEEATEPEAEAEAIEEAAEAEAEAVEEAAEPEVEAEAVEEAAEPEAEAEAEAIGEAAEPEVEPEVETPPGEAAEAERTTRAAREATEAVSEEAEAPPEAAGPAEAEAAGEETAAAVEETARAVEAEPVAEEGEGELEAEAGEGRVGRTAELRAWRAGISADTSAIPEPDIGEAAQGGARVREQGSTLRAGRQEARRRIPREAREAVSPPPQTENPPPPPEPDPVPEATQLVDEASDRRLPDQTMPRLRRSPHGTLPRVGQRPAPERTRAPVQAPMRMTLVRVEEGAESEPAEPTEEQTPEQERVEEVRERAEETPDTEREDQGEGVTLTDTAPPPQPELPPGAQTVISSVLVRLLADPGAEAEAILEQARQAAYPNEKLQLVYPDIGNEHLPDLTESLTSELRTVAEEAGIASDELDAQIEQHRNELAQQREDANSETDQAATEERENLEQAGQEEQDAIAGAREAVDEHTERQLEAASGEGDPSVIRARRDRLLRRVNRKVGQQLVVYEQAKRRREGQLDVAMQAQIGAYQATAQQDERAIIAEAGEERPVPLEVRLEAAAVRDWASARERELWRTVIDMKRTAQRRADGYREDMRTAGTRAQELIREWADERLGEQRSWLQRLFDLFRGWSEQAHAESEAWETVRAGETRDAILTDFVALNQFRTQAGENVDLSNADALRGLSEEQQAVIRAYYSSGPDARNPISAVAAGLRVRLSRQRRPQLIQRFDSELEGKPDSEWENLDLLGKAQQGSFSADRIRNELYQAMHGGVTGWGTDEARIFRALNSLTTVQSLAVRKCYSDTHERSLEDDLESELGGAELTRAQAQLSGDQTLADVATLHEAMHGGITGWGTDEDVIMRTLRGKSEEERQRIIEEYRRQYDVDLSAELDSELSSHDLERANALMEGDTARADAIAIDQAMRGGIFGWGTEEADIEGVYNQVRQDVAAEGARQRPPWTTEQVEAEIARRNLSVERSYNVRYGGDWEPGDESALRQAYRSELSGPELDLTNALADNDLIRADAARIAIEAQAVFVTDDDVVNGVLRRQYERALEELRRDEWPDIERRLNEQAQREGWDSYRRRAEERRLQRELEQRAQRRARGYMRQLESSYDENYSRWGAGGLQSMIWFNMSGNDRDMARDLVRQGGYLSPAQEIHYAVAGAGTDEDAIRRVLTGRSPEEIAEIREEWARLHPGEDMDERLRSELSGRDEFDTRMQLQGEPQNAEQEIAQMRERARWELENSSGFLAGEEERILRDRMERLEEQYRIINDPNVTGTERRLAIERFRQRAGYVSTAIEGYREQMDAATDALATTAGIAAAIVVVVVAAVLTPFTGGGSAAAGAGILAALGGALTSGTVAAAAAVAAATATIVTKQAMLGDAYGGEDMAVDIVVGAVDALAAYATAGMGAGLLKAARGGALARMAASSSRMTRVAAHGLAEGAEGLISSLPSAVMGNVLNDRNWEHGNPLVNILTGTAIETGIGTVMSAGMGSFSGLRQVEVPPPEARPTGDILAHRGTPQDRIAQWRAYQAEHPDADMRTFLRQYDEGVALRLADEEAAHQLQRQLRTELLSGIPPAQRRQFADTTVEVMSDADFERLTRSQRGQAAVLIEGDRPRVILREGADPRVLREEGIHLLQATDPRFRPQVRQLDERRLANWDQMDIEEQVQLYRTKLELEIDAQERLIRGLQDDLAQAGDDAVVRRSLLEQMDAARRDLDNLQNRLDEVDSFTPSERLQMSRGQRSRPQYLDQPARLFAKRKPTPEITSLPDSPPTQREGNFYAAYDRVRDKLPSGHEWVVEESSRQAWVSGSNLPFYFRLKRTNPSVPEMMLVREGGRGRYFKIVLRGDYPPEPPGFYYRHQPGKVPEYQLAKIRGADTDVRYRIEVGDDGKPVRTERAGQPNWDERKGDLAKHSPDPVSNQFGAFEGHLSSLNLPDREAAVLRRWWQQTLMVYELLDILPGPRLREDFLKNMFTTVREKLRLARSGADLELPESAYDEFRRLLRSETASLISRAHDQGMSLDAMLNHLLRNPHLNRLRIREDRPGSLLNLFMRSQPDPSASKGHLFSAYRRERLRRQGKVFELCDSDARVLSVVRPSGESVNRTADGVVRIKSQSGKRAAGEPPPGTYLVEDKAGPEAFKLKQAQDYARAYRDRGIRLDPGDPKPRYRGIAYFFDSAQHAQTASRKLRSDSTTRDALRDSEGGIFIGYFDNRGRLIWL